MKKLVSRLVSLALIGLLTAAMLFVTACGEEIPNGKYVFEKMTLEYFNVSATFMPSDIDETDIDGLDVFFDA